MILTTTTDSVRAPAAGAVGARQRGSARRRARELALQGVYAWLIQGPDASVGEIDAHLRDAEAFHEVDQQWYRTLLDGVTRGAPALRAAFEPHIDRPVNELSPVEHAILLLASHELRHHVEVPYKVVINEAVELAKSFGGSDGFKFINGVLDRVAASERPAEVQAAADRQR